MAGKITHAFFDKTGTLTTDSLISKVRYYSGVTIALTHLVNQPVAY